MNDTKQPYEECVRCPHGVPYHSDYPPCWACDLVRRVELLERALSAVVATLDGRNP